MDADEYIHDRLDDQIAWYDSKSSRNQRLFKRLRMAEIVAAAAIPVLTAFVDPERPLVTVSIGVLGAAVAVIAGAMGLYQFERLWVEYRTTCEGLRKEKYLFLTGSEPFDRELADNFRLLVQRVESLVSKENTSWAQHITKPQNEEGP